MNKLNPLISVVTVCYNSNNDIEKTMESVFNQTYSNVEYIVIDGGSKDGTVDIINEAIDKITYFVSEPDRGIYDAMNKGVRAAKGDWIIFMNSGDVFASEDAITKCFVNIENGTKVIYGDRIAEYAKASYIEKPGPIKDFDFRFPIFHQSTFIRCDVMKRLEYDARFKICGDFDFFRKLYLKGEGFQYKDVIISKCECITGISNTLNQTKTRICEDCIIVHGRITKIDNIRILYAQLIAFVKKKWMQLMPSIYEKWRYKSYDNNPYFTKI